MNPDTSVSPRRTASRWSWLAVLTAVAAVVACNSNLQVLGGDNEFGFVTVAASKTTAGEYQTAPLAQFFKGRLSTIPNAAVVYDSCVPDVNFGESPEIVPGVNFLDAGDPVTAQLGTVVTPLNRITSGTATIYQPASGAFVTYTPGDSIVVKIPGASAGYPAGEVHGKSAEPFTIDPVVAPSGVETIQFHWSQPSDPNSAMIISMRYSPAGTGATPTKQLLCAFVDDGADSVPYRIHRFWSDPTNVAREMVATRLRTSLVAQSHGILEVISRFQVPTPVIP